MHCSKLIAGLEDLVQLGGAEVQALAAGSSALEHDESKPIHCNVCNACIACTICTKGQLVLIPHICHFFYTERIFENQILHPKKRLKAPIPYNCHFFYTDTQGCISCGMCSYPELTKDHVLTSAYVNIFRTVTRNAVNKSV